MTETTKFVGAPPKGMFQVFFSLKGSARWPRPSIVDFIHEGRGLYGKQTLEELRAEYPDGEVLDDAEAQARYEAAYITGPKPITCERFHEALNVLPPGRWVRRCDHESFYVTEAIAANIVAFFVRIGDTRETFYEIHLPRSTPHDEVVRRCLPAAAK
jgi:hypothetical protein